MTRVAHLSTAHGRRDIRVHLKQCNSLAVHGYDVHYIVADGLGEERIDGVQVHDIGRPSSRISRMIWFPWRMLAAAWKIKARVYHFHDPELLLVALFLRNGGARVIYDSHEDVPRSILSRSWIHASIRKRLSTTFELFENFVSRRMSAVVGATPHITARFARLNSRAVAINNYPLLNEIGSVTDKCGPSRNICYLGGISGVRGIEEMLRALSHVDARLVLAGPFETVALEKAVRLSPTWHKVDYRGTVSRAEVRDILAKSQAGLVLFHPEPNHVDAQPNKMFEYMASGTPLIASDFPLWREIVLGNKCGFCVDPMDPIAIAKAIDFMIQHPQQARQMGENGRRAVLERYTWAREETRLLALYKAISSSQ